jgi:hypothetical protein
MKILHIGKQGNLQRFAAADGFLNSLDLVDLKPDLPVEEYLSQAGDADFIVADAIAAVPGALIKCLICWQSILKALLLMQLI